MRCKLRMLQPGLVFGLLVPCLGVHAGRAQPAMPHKSQDDATWAKAYATDCGAARKHPCSPSSNGYENQFNVDPRLPALLRRSLPQRESWWIHGHAGSAAVSGIVQEFIGVPKELIVDEGRFVSASGCVPHICLLNGLLWIDTGTQPATVVFAAEDMIQDLTSSTDHLWIYCSQSSSCQALPTDLLSSLTRWHDSIVDPKYDPQTITLATLVQPNGRMQDLTYEMLFYKQNQPKFSSNGAKQ